MNKLISLNYAIHSVRIELINNEPWFCLTDVCEILEIANAGNTASRLDEAGIRKMDIRYESGTKSLNFINEPNLYRVIFRSNKAEAEKFQNWVFNEVLPTIRKTGQYSITPTQPATINNYHDRELRTQMNNITRYFRNSSNEVSLKLWSIIKSQLQVERIADIPRNEYQNIVNWLRTFQTVAHQNYLRECDVENQLIKSAASIHLDNLHGFKQIQERVSKNAKVITLF